MSHPSILRPGSQGSDVERLQQDLSALVSLRSQL